MFSRVVTLPGELLEAAKKAGQVLDGTPWIFTLKKVRKGRSLKSNKLYWAWLHVISHENGDTPQYLHEWYKTTFLAEELVEGSAGDLAVAASTTRLDTKQMAEYMEKVRMHARDFFSIHLPMPGDVGYDEMAAT